jgi:hypothetical protein
MTSPAARLRRANLLLWNGKGIAVRILGGTCGLLGDSCVHPEPPRCDAHEALEVTAELALVPEAGVRGDLRKVRSCLQELLGPLAAASRFLLSHQLRLPDESGRWRRLIIRNVA